MEYDMRHLADGFGDVFQGIHGLVPFPLFQLPPEIWLRVCEIAVTEPRPINVTKSPEIGDQVKTVRQPALTRTCRLLRTEALPMFYRNNTFEARHYCDYACPRQWMVAIGLANLKAMRNFRLHTRMSDTFWKGCFERMGLVTEVEVTAKDTKGKCPKHWHGRFQTLTMTFL